MNRDLRPSIMRNQEWDAAAAELHALDLSELVLGLLVLDAVHREAALGVVDEAEVLARLLDRDDVHEAGRVRDVGADLAVNLDQALHHDGLGLAVVERVLQPVADEDDQRHAVAQLVGTRRGTRGVDTRQFVEQPVRRRAEALLVLLSVREDRSVFRLQGIGHLRVTQSCHPSRCRRADPVDSQLGLSLTVLYPS
jgi:hypothetical protein